MCVRISWICCINNQAPNLSDLQECKVLHLNIRVRDKRIATPGWLGRKAGRKEGRQEGSQEDRKGRLVAVLFQVNGLGIQAYGMTFLELDVTEEEIHGQAYVVFDCFCLEIA